MSQVGGVGGHRDGLGATYRTDAWWVEPAATAFALLAWLAYYFFVAFQGRWYAAGPYISPFFAPLFFVDPTAEGAAAVEHAFFGAFPDWWPAPIASPALLILPFPGLLRLTCYYYRKAYYRSFSGNPPACAVGTIPTGRRYRGETGLLVVQNLHRYTLYFGLALLPFLFYEAGRAFFHEGRCGVGVGSVLLLVNAILLSGYTLGCHSWRHLVGGRLDCFSCDAGTRTAHGAWRFTSWLNARHAQFAWASLFWILGADLYVRLVSAGVLPDLNTWHGVTWISEF